jgi:hypothetical protein
MPQKALSTMHIEIQNPAHLHPNSSSTKHEYGSLTGYDLKIKNSKGHIGPFSEGRQ